MPVLATITPVRPEDFVPRKEEVIPVVEEDPVLVPVLVSPIFVPPVYVITEKDDLANEIRETVIDDQEAFPFPKPYIDKLT